MPTVIALPARRKIKATRLTVAFQGATLTENPRVGGSIPPLATI